MSRRLLILSVLLIFISGLLAFQESIQKRGVRPVDSKKEQDRNQKIALVIGNSAYKKSPLKNPVNDAIDMADVLKKCGFDVILKTNANQLDMEKTVREFSHSLKVGGVGLFYFSGHGVQVEGINYLIPVNSNIRDEIDVIAKSVSANYILGKMDKRRDCMNIMILDISRNNPFAKEFRSTSRGLALMDAPEGSLIVYATSPGKTADDGTGRNGIFTKHLLKMIKETPFEIMVLLRKVRKNVMDETKGKQIPWESSSLLRSFYFSYIDTQLEEERLLMEKKRKERLEQEKKRLAQRRGIRIRIKNLAPDNQVGKQYLVLIAINKYENWPPLYRPVKDAEEIREPLESRYYIDEVLTLYDEKATKAGIIKLFKELQRSLEVKDSVLIFYAGHGHLDKASKNGFWIPVDGGLDENVQERWIPNSIIRGLISQMKSKHILLISDSCFSGDLLEAWRERTPAITHEYFKKAYKRRSRQVLTSGASERVPDNSEFAAQLKLALEENDKPYLDPLSIYNEIRWGIKGTLPMFGYLKGTNHQEGGAFLFFLKEDSIRFGDRQVKKFVEFTE